MQTDSDIILGLDVGTQRIGIARGIKSVRLASPLTTIAHAADVSTQLAAIVAKERASALVIGLPRNMAGADTEQTAYTRQFAAQLVPLGLPISFQDEAVTSEKAEAELRRRGKPYEKGDIDALAATYIVEDYLQEL